MPVPAGCAARHADTGQQLVGLKRRREQPQEEVVNRDRPAARSALPLESSRRAPAAQRGSRRPDRLRHGCRRWCRGCGRADRRSAPPLPAEADRRAFSSFENSISRCVVSAPIDEGVAIAPDAAQLLDAAEIDERRRLARRSFISRQQRLAAREQFRVRLLREQRDRVLHARGPLILKNPCCDRPYRRPVCAAGARSRPRIARHTFSAVKGISRCVMPNGLSASTTAFATAAVDAIVPASPMPFTPSGLCGVRRHRGADFERRQIVRARHRVFEERCRW